MSNNVPEKDNTPLTPEEIERKKWWEEALSTEGLTWQEREEARTRIGLWRVQLFERYNFFYQLFSDMRIVDMSGNFPTAGVYLTKRAKIGFGYNARFINKLTDIQGRAVVLHELMHIVYDHIARRYDRHPELYNIATDMVINANIPEMSKHPEQFKDFLAELHVVEKYKTIVDALPGNTYSQKFYDVTSEQIYDMLYKEFPPKKVSFCKAGQGKGKGNCLQQGPGTHQGWDADGDKEVDGVAEENQPGDPNNEAARQAVQDAVRKAASRASNHSRGIGNVPGNIKRVIDELMKVRFDWRTELEIFVQSEAKEEKERSFKRLRRRPWVLGRVVPGDKRQYRPRIVVGLDNSGSIDEDTFNLFVGHLMEIAKVCERIDFIACDTQVNHHTVVDLTEQSSSKPPKYEDVGSGGGTLFQPFFDWAKNGGKADDGSFNSEDEVKADGLIILTDGHNFDNHALNSYDIPVIFAITPDGQFKDGYKNVRIKDE